MRFPFLIYFPNKIRKVNVNWLILGNYENSWQGGTDERSSLRFIKKVFWTLYNSQFWPWKATSKKRLLWVVPEGICMECQWEKTRCPKKVFSLLLHTHNAWSSLKRVSVYNTSETFCNDFQRLWPSRIELRLVCWLLLKGWLDFLVAFSTCFW